MLNQNQIKDCLKIFFVYSASLAVIACAPFKGSTLIGVKGTNAAGAATLNPSQPTVTKTAVSTVSQDPTQQTWMLTINTGDATGSVSTAIYAVGQTPGSSQAFAQGQLYEYDFQAQCLNATCTQLVVMMSEENTAQSTWLQNSYFFNDSGNGTFQLWRSVRGSDFDDISQAIDALNTYGPVQ